jgi:UDP-N-acetyl-D-glucosamine dehydrogenase
MPVFFAGIALGKLGTLAAKRILIVGIAYKPNVSDMRESPAVELIAELRSRGAEVSWHDDLVGTWAGESSTPLTADYDLVIFVNPHPGTDISLLGTAHVLDTRGGY